MADWHLRNAQIWEVNIFTISWHYFPIKKKKPTTINEFNVEDVWSAGYFID
ncbi:hypothetical protein C357_00389 [Citreicella sp. 357]|nr:hypothetical protein C357_00389 [Citreicella sp. 357]